MKRYILCCDNGRWYEMEAKSPNEAIKATRNFDSGDTVTFIFAEENEEDCQITNKNSIPPTPTGAGRSGRLFGPPLWIEQGQNRDQENSEQNIIGL